MPGTRFCAGNQQAVLGVDLKIVVHQPCVTITYVRPKCGAQDATITKFGNIIFGEDIVL